MTVAIGQTARNLLEAPLVLPKGVESVGRALWLYVRLLTLTNDQGLIIRTRKLLADDLKVSESTIDEWLARLTKAALIEVKTPAPYLVIRLGMWSDVPSKVADVAASSYSYSQELLHKQLSDS